MDLQRGFDGADQPLLGDRLDQKVESAGSDRIKRRLRCTFSCPNNHRHRRVDLGQHGDDVGVQALGRCRVDHNDPNGVAMAAENLDAGMRRIGDMDGVAVRLDRSLHAAALGSIFIDE